MKRKGINILRVICFSVLLLYVQPAWADLISADDSVFGIDSVTTDTDTGLDWLDLNKSRERTYNDVATQFGTGGDFEGWRHAAADELSVLFTNAGLPINGPPLPEDYDDARGLMNLINVSYGGMTGSYSIGFFDDGTPSSNVGIAGVYANEGFAEKAGYTRINADAISPDDTQTTGIGNFIVRRFAVPEASTTVLLGMALLGIVVLRRKLRME